MNTIQIKSDLHQLVDKVNDVSLLNAVRVILSREISEVKDWSETTDEFLLENLEESILEANKGKTISHKQAMDEIKNRYKQ